MRNSIQRWCKMHTTTLSRRARALHTFAATASFVFGILSVSSLQAQERREICRVPSIDVNSFDVMSCVKDGDMYGQLYMTSTTTANLSVRQVLNLECEARGFDVTGNNWGRLTAGTDEGEVEGCFVYDGSCMDFSPIRYVQMWCYLRSE